MPNTPRVLALVPSLIASCQIGVLKPLRALSSRGAINLRWSLEYKASLSDIHWSDIVIFCRNTEPAYGHLLNEAVSTSKPIIYDLDDNFWDIPFDTDPELARYHRLPPRIQQLERYLELASLVRVYSPVMLDRVMELNPNTRLLKAGFDFGLVKRNVDRAPHAGKVRVVYATSRIVDDQYHEFLDGMIEVLDRYGDRVELTVWGCQPRELAGRRGVKLVRLLPDYDKFLRGFSRQRFDIGLAPLPDTLFHRSKTNTKFRDYGACGVAGVYSNVDVYSSCVEDGVTGILVDNHPDAWFHGISRLIDNPDLRRSIADLAYERVYGEYRQQLVEQEWLRQIEQLLGGSTGYAASTAKRNVKVVRVRADFNGLCGISFPANAPDGEAVGRTLMEVMTATGNTLREASTTVMERNGLDDVLIKFEPIMNSRDQEFLLRFIAPGEESDCGTNENWIPTAAYIQMIYSKTNAHVRMESPVVDAVGYALPATGGTRGAQSGY
ncbi:MAG TPA: glycosyltransferase [Candidatus Obscuribacterales bacterium]